jgi:hypothetical protein
VSRGSITLGAVAAHTAVVTVGCSRCDRAARYRLDRLIARHGPACCIPDVLRLLSKDCVLRASVKAYDLCGVHCPELPGVLPEHDGPKHDGLMSASDPAVASACDARCFSWQHVYPIACRCGHRVWCKHRESALDGDRRKHSDRGRGGGRVYPQQCLNPMVLGNIST